MLSVVMVTRGDAAALPFIRETAALAEWCRAELVLGADGGCEQALREIAPRALIVPVDARGLQETVQDSVIEWSTGDYVLRLDDDERPSPTLSRWLHARDYEAGDHWRFARAWMVGGDRYIVSAPHWPDYQTRLSIRAKSRGRRRLHDGSLHGPGAIGPGAIEHFKLIVLSREEREEQCRRYDAIDPGAGLRAFYVPEEGRQVVTENWVTT